jgi:hypothetical protein
MEDPVMRRLFDFVFVCVAFGLSSPQLGASELGREINVSTVDQLYAAVNNAKNVGATIHLAPGTYVLSATSAEGVTRPHGGYLRLPPGMSLVGSEERVDSNFDGVPDPVSPTTPDDFAVPGTETKIDGSELFSTPKLRADCDGEGYAFGEAVISISRNNSISFLNIFGGDNGPIAEHQNQVDSNMNHSAKVVNTVLDGGIINVGFSNTGCKSRHARSVLIFSNNVVRNSFSFGLVLVNFSTGSKANETTSGPEIKATVSYNLFYNHGLAAVTARGGAYGTDGGLVTLEMTGNIFRNNNINFFGFGCGGGRPVSSSAVGNRLHVTSRFDTFEESAFQSVLLLGFRTVEPVEPQHCRLEAEFIHSKFVRDKPVKRRAPEISILGSEDGGSDNHAIVLIRQATVKTSAGKPIFGTLTIYDETSSSSLPNTARLKGTLEVFMQTNQGFHAPEAKFFLKK